MFITFEGIDGSGKSHQIQRLADRLRATQDRAVIVTREPGGSHIGDAIRRILLSTSGAYSKINPTTELLLFCAARFQHVQELIKPALRIGHIVICDRYADSTIAYQMYGHGLPLQQVSYIASLSMDGVIPDLTFLMDMPTEEAQKRRATMGANRMDTFDVAFYDRVRKGYLSIASDDPSWRIVNAMQDEDRIAEYIMQCITAHEAWKPHRISSNESGVTIHINMDWNAFSQGKFEDTFVNTMDNLQRAGKLT